MTLFLWMAGISLFTGCVVAGFVWYGFDVVALVQNARGKPGAAPAAESTVEEAAAPKDEVI